MINKDITGRVHALESFGLVDGPGVRFVVFLQGCTMRCKYCHNPDTWDKCGGEVKTAEELFNNVYKYRNYWGDKGGVTVSGGEPLLQMEFVTELFKLAKEKNIHTVIDTSGQPFCRDEEWLEKFEELMKVTDLVMLDLKEMDSEKHRELTGFGNENILDMARWLSDNGKDMWLRHVLVPELTDDEAGLIEMDKFISSLNNVKRVEILPYHTLGLAKWQSLGIKYPLDGVRTPTADEKKRAEELLHIENYTE